MSARRLGWIVLVCFWLIVGMGYVWAASQQKQRINLSAAAGGQYPYLAYARQVAETGVTRHFGDRNRMPLYPSLLALVHDEDWDIFVAGSAWFAIFSSLVILVGIGGLAYGNLPPWPATALTLTAVVAVFIYKASFVQAELLYYGLLLASWLLLCRVIRRPGAWWALPAGVLLGFTYLTKASGAATLVAYIAAVGVQAVVLAWPAKTPAGKSLTHPVSPRARDVLLSGVIVVVAFLVVAYPYLSNNQARFGRYFYNVNSTFFMWCDSWKEAQAFADTYHISEQYPEAPPDKIPGPLNYWRTHSPRRILGRLGYGFSTLAALAWHGPYAKYLALVVVFCLALGAGQVRRLKKPALEDWIIGLFWAMFFLGYLFSYAWYARVAYGDRFLLSLFLPAIFAVWWWACRLSHSIPSKRLLGVTRPLSDFLAVSLVLLLLAEGGYVLTTSLYRPTPTFVQFYYNESRELLSAGNVNEATRGFKGVIKLDPTFAAAHHDLGIIALRAGRIDDAIETLTQAVRLDPGVADMHNSLGSALVQAGRTEEAIRAFRRATDVDPELAVAWYNLGGSCLRSGLDEEARVVQRRLELLDPRLAEQLRTLFAD